MIIADICMPAMHTCHQVTPCGTAHSRTRIKISKDHTLFCHTVNVRGLDLLLSVTTKFPVSKVVGHDNDYIRLCACRVFHQRFRTTCKRYRT